ncbi:MAG: alkene reductase [Leptospiraceae bacterium]|nr:alkene reductase [Leptospiraceae bacterium]
MTQSISPYLLSPVQLGDLSLPNRVVLAPLTRSRSGECRIPNELMATYYSQRASAGLLISEATVISPQGIGWLNTPGIYSEAQVEGWKTVVNSVHSKGGHIFLQLWHMGRASHSSFHSGKLPVAPSAIPITGSTINTPIGVVPHEVPRSLETEEIPPIVENYRHAAENAKRAGFDGIEIHGANGYLIDQFLQFKTNERRDRYGKNIENRFQFLKEVTEACLTVWDAKRVGIRISPNGVFNDMGSPDYRESFLYYAERLNTYGLGYLHIMDGLAFGFHDLGLPMTLKEFRAVFTGTIIGNCGYVQETAEQAIRENHADLIAFGRSYISNPDLVERFSNNWQLNPDADRNTWYSFESKGYTDFATYDV